jgi:RimJ/RimL family protein N-acetyltransferase
MTLRTHLQTARLRLRPVAASDEAAVVACLNDLAVTGWLAVVPYPYVPADFHQFQTEIAKPGETFAVDDAAGLAGIVGIGATGELGYWFAPRAHGQGYATEAARAVLADRFAHRPDELTSGYFEGNIRSANVLAKLGFTETGRGMRHCRALGQDRPHVELSHSRDQFIAALPVEARSARLTYRAMQAVDAPALHAIVSHWDVTRQLGPKWPWPAEMAFTETRATPYAGAGFAWGIFLGPDLIGTVAVTEGELGYMLAPAAWGKGFAHEACQTALARAFADGLTQIHAGIWADNLASQGLLERLGFHRTGENTATSFCRPDPSPGYDYSLTPAEWQRA